MLKLADLRKTTRKSREDGLRTVYPRFLRDRALDPRVELAIRYLEKMLGRARRELDQEVVVGILGDHKLARCILACLASSYRHRTRTFAEVLPVEAVASLAVQGITTPSDLRLWLFRRANAMARGFVGAPERPGFLRDAGAALGISVEQIEQLIALDEPSQAVLVRTGPIPTAEDVRARYNYAVAAALLANAPLVRVALARSPRDASAVRALCEQYGVRASLSARELVLHGQQDGMESWMRHGTRLVRLLTGLLVCGLPARAGEALVAAPTGGQWRFRLDAEILGYLGARPDAAFATADLVAALGRQEAMLAEFAALRRSDTAGGWALRRATEPLIVAGSVVPALFACTRESARVALVLAPQMSSSSRKTRVAGDGEILADLGERLPIVALRAGPHDSPADDEVDSQANSHTGAGVAALHYARRGDLVGLPGLLEAAVERAERAAGTQRLAALLDEVRAVGVLTEATLAERLGCDEEQVTERLTAPEIQSAWAERNLHYVEGFGLCTSSVLTRARAAAADVASLRERADGATRVARVLGRRLREVTGASEGIECLIAYLGAA